MRVVVVWISIVVGVAAAQQSLPAGSTPGKESVPSAKSAMHTFIYFLTPARPGQVDEPTPNEQRIAEEHFAYLENLVNEGVVLLVGRTQGTKGNTRGIIIFKASNLEEAEKIMKEDPGVKKGLQKASIFPFRVALESISRASP